MNFILTLVKITTVFVLILAYLLTSFVVGLLVWDTWKLREVRTHLISFYSRLGLAVMNVEVSWSGETLTETNSQLIVCNHLSYIDILVLAGQWPTAFVTSREVEKTPFLGQMCRMGGCLFVERRSREFLGQEIQEITEALSRNINVTIFPEATSTNGESVLRFRRPLYNASLLSGRPTQALCINYLSVNDEPVTKRNRDSLFWYGDMSFLPHLWRFCSLGRVSVQISGVGQIQPEPQFDCGDLAERTHSWVKENYVPI